jgi:hypothetical protein
MSRPHRPYARNLKILAGEHAAVTASALDTLLALQHEAAQLERQRITDIPPTSSELEDLVAAGQAAAAGVQQAIETVVAETWSSLRCQSCGVRRRLEPGECARFIRDGWPECCGFTMELLGGGGKRVP